MRQFLIYGDDATYSVPSPESVNLKGKGYQHYDEAGLVTMPSYDFKGNLLEKEQQVIKDSELLSIFTGSGPYTCYRVDWTGVPASVPNIVDGSGHLTTIEYDAMDRVTKMIYPWDLTSPTPERKELVPVYNNAGALESVALNGTTYIEHIAYNAKGQRLMIAYGNGVMTRYAYDALTFRLLRQRSESYTQSTWAYTSAGNVKQDTAYDYDLMANITESHERTTGCGIGGTNSLDRDYDYDAIYRVLSANGRENAPAITPIWDDSYRSSNDSLTTAYTQNYAYDKLGNIQTLQHIEAGNFTRNFNYTNTGNILDSVDIGATNFAFTYDACGNQLTETSSRHWEWDAADRPRCFYVEASGSITQYTQYLYDNGGKRVKKLTWKTGGTYDSISYIDAIFEYRTDGVDEQNLLHIMDNRSRIAMIRIGDNFGDSTPVIQYNLEDNIGGSILLLEDNGTNINKEEYYPSGETSFGSYAEKRYKYCAKERDKESGLYYYGARYYSAWICKFVSVDPLAKKYPFYGPYDYAGNKPVNKIDIDGMQEEGREGAPNPRPQGADTKGPTKIYVDVNGTSAEYNAAVEFGKKYDALRSADSNLTHEDAIKSVEENLTSKERYVTYKKYSGGKNQEKYETRKTVDVFKELIIDKSKVSSSEVVTTKPELLDSKTTSHPDKITFDSHDEVNVPSGATSAKLVIKNLVSTSGKVIVSISKKGSEDLMFEISMPKGDTIPGNGQKEYDIPANVTAIMTEEIIDTLNSTHGYIEIGIDAKLMPPNKAAFPEPWKTVNKPSLKEVVQHYEGR